MSSCIKELYDYDLIKQCCRCGILSLMCIFYKDKTKRNGYRPKCKICSKKYSKKYYYDNQDRLLNKQKMYDKQNRVKVNSNDRMRRQLDINYRLIKNTRCRIYHAFNGKTESSSTLDILGIDTNLYKKWVEYQFTPETNWSNIEIDHVKPICMFNVSDDDELKVAFNWKNTQPLLKEVHSQKGVKFNFLDYQLQFIKAYQFLKLKEEGFNEKIH